MRWAADPVFCQAADWTVGLSPRVIRRHWVALIASKQADFRRWDITLDGRLVGYVDLANLKAASEESTSEELVSGELGVVLGERNLWGQGVSRRACKLLLEQAWATGLHTVTAEVHAPNERSHALMRRLGFRECRMTEPQLYQGVPVAMVQYVLRRPDGEL
ncbi:GNAT family protein [Deinococcus deserti]